MEYNLKEVTLENKNVGFVYIYSENACWDYNFIELLITEVTNCMLFSYHYILFFKRTAMV